MSASGTSRIKNIMAIDAQIFVGLAKLICLVTTPDVVPQSVTDLSRFQNTTLAHDIFSIISKIVTASSFDLSR